MMNVTTYNVYVEPTPDGPALIGDAQDGVLSIEQPGPAVIDVQAIGGLNFAPTPLVLEGNPAWTGWAPAASAATEVVINVIVAAVNQVRVTFNVVSGGAAITVPMTISTSLAVPASIGNSVAG
jgi:hypothetical protein